MVPFMSLFDLNKVKDGTKSFVYFFKYLVVFCWFFVFFLFFFFNLFLAALGLHCCTAFL